MRGGRCARFQVSENLPVGTEIIVSRFVERGFCCNCGSPLFFSPVNEDWVGIQTGTLDDPELAPPQGHYGVESWISWLKIEDKLKREPTQEDEYG